MFKRIGNLIKGFLSLFIGGIEKRNPQALLEVEKENLLKKANSEHDEVLAQLETSEARYKELIKARDVSVKEAKDKIESLRRGIDDMKVQTAVAELNEMASGMVSSIGGSGDTLNRLEEIVEDQRTQAAGRARVARDSMDMSEINMKESEQDALAEMALADFAAGEGIEIEPSEAAPSGGVSEATDTESESGTMGPTVSN